MRPQMRFTFRENRLCLISNVKYSIKRVMLNLYRIIFDIMNIFFIIPLFKNVYHEVYGTIVKSSMGLQSGHVGYNKFFFFYAHAR